MDSRNDGQRHLPWAEQPFSALLKLAWPIAVSMLSASTMSLVDTLFVGRLGSSALAGVGLAGTACFAVLVFPWGALSGAKVLVSQSIGAGKREQAGPLCAAALLVALGFGLMIALSGRAASSLLQHLSASSASGVFASTYFGIRVLAAPVFLAGVAMREVRYGLGDSQGPMRTALAANALNIALDYLLIIVMQMGVAGAAVATVASQCVETALLLGPVVRGRLLLRGFHLEHLRALWKMGAPTGLQWTLEMGAFAMLAVMISLVGESQMAAHQIALQVIHFSFLPAIAIGESASVLAGQAVGAGQYDLVRPLARKALAVAAGYMGAFSLLLLLGGARLARAFTDEPAVVGCVVHLFLIAAGFQVFDAAYTVVRATLRGTGDVRYPAVAGVVISWVCTPPLMWLLGYRLGWGAAGGWLGLCLELILGSAWMWRRLERGAWRSAADAAHRACEPSPPVLLLPSAAE